MATSINGQASTAPQGGQTQQFINPYANVKNPYADLQNPYTTDAYTKSIKDKYSAQLNEAVASPETSQQAAAMRNKLAGMGVIGGKSYDKGQQDYVSALRNKYASAEMQDLSNAQMKGMEFGASNALESAKFGSNLGLQSGLYESNLPFLQQQYATGEQGLASGAMDMQSQQDILNAAKTGGYDSPFMMDLAMRSPDTYKKYQDSATMKKSGMSPELFAWLRTQRAV